MSRECGHVEEQPTTKQLDVSQACTIYGIRLHLWGDIHGDFHWWGHNTGESMSRAKTIRSANDAIRCTRYDTFRDTFAILTWEAEACDPGLQSEALHSTDYNCMRSNDAQWLQQWWPSRSFQMQCFVMNLLILLEYTDCFLCYLVFVSNFGMCYICTVSYRIVLRAYRDTYHSLCIGNIPVCRCIVSALSMRM